jgi:hypothetical protein
LDDDIKFVGNIEGMQELNNKEACILDIKGKMNPFFNVVLVCNNILNV